ncbi:hypothetical protein DMB90_09720 [Raoultella planticola]|uniref:Thiomethylgalactoside permease II n=1 Tax=Raoultella planticola TaxID=575 RepID=A0A5P6A9L8_RAOPL|nr:hypothetical protein DMB90_09720 [Raoultella planticola]
MFKFGPKWLWSMAFSLMIAVLIYYLGLYVFHIQLSDSAAFVTILILSALFQIGRQTMEYTVWNVIPLVPDVDTLVSTKLRAGTFAACQTFTRKLTGAIGSAIIGWILAFGGFDKSLAVQIPAAQIAIMIAFIFIPLICLIYSLYLIRTFNLNPQTHKVVKAEMDRLQQGRQRGCGPETRAIVEDLTGYAYDEIWDVKNDHLYCQRQYRPADPD